MKVLHGSQSLPHSLPPGCPEVEKLSASHSHSHNALPEYTEPDNNHGLEPLEQRQNLPSFWLLYLAFCHSDTYVNNLKSRRLHDSF